MMNVPFEEISGDSELPVHRYAILDASGVLVSVTMWDGVSPWTPPNGETAELFDVAKHVVVSVPPVPDEVQMWKARVALKASPSKRAGKTLFDDVNEAVQALGGVALDAWEYSTTISRAGSFVESLGKSLELTEDQIDGLFRQAAQISI